MGKQQMVCCRSPRRPMRHILTERIRTRQGIFCQEIRVLREPGTLSLYYSTFTLFPTAIVFVQVPFP